MLFILATERAQAEQDEAQISRLPATAK